MLLPAVGCYDCLYCLMIVALGFCGFWVYLRVRLLIVGVWCSFWLCFGFVVCVGYLLCSDFWCLGIVITVFEYSVLGFLCTWYFGCVFRVGLRFVCV